MSLVVSNLATEKQRNWLIELGYIGRGKYAVDKLDKQEASELINELLEEERLERKRQYEPDCLG